MYRSSIKETAQKKTTFRLRGLDNTRIEALSDGVFALAIALLLLSTRVPKTFAELLTFLDDMIPFGITITLLTTIWYQHYIFFVRYGLKGPGIVALNGFLLFLLLFYVYPLKFLFRTLYDLLLIIYFQDKEKLNYLFSEVLIEEDMPQLMVIYGLGAASVFIVLAAMYAVAYSKRIHLDLNAIERFDTRTSIYDNLIMAAVPFISAWLAFVNVGGVAAKTFRITGIFYLLYALVIPLFSIYRSRKRKKLNQSFSAS